MNTRDLILGLAPLPEFARKHSYDSTRFFPELQKTHQAINDLHTRLEDHQPLGLTTKNKKNLSRDVTFTSTHQLELLQKSSFHEVTGLNDMRKSLFESRRRVNASLELAKPVAVSSKKKDAPMKDPLTIANEKLTKKSISFDPNATNNHLKAFNGVLLSKKDLHMLLRRCLNIILNNAECDALFECMDVDGSGLIDGVEFARYFYDLGNKARAQVQLDKIEVNRRKDEERRTEEKARLEKIKFEQDAQIAHDFTSSDLNAAIRKLGDVALYWDTQSETALATQYALETYLTPYEFKKQVETSFDLRFTGPEIGALIKEYSTRDHEACIDGYLFLKRFIHLQQKRREEKKIRMLANKVHRERILGPTDMGSKAQLGR